MFAGLARATPCRQFYRSPARVVQRRVSRVRGICPTPRAFILGRTTPWQQLAQVRAVIAGFGFLGSRIAGILSDAHYQVTAIKRTTPARSSGIIFDTCDLTMGEPHFADRKFAAAVFCLAPGSRDAALYRKTYCEAQENFLAGVDAGQYIYISSTAVYPEAGGDYTESSALPHSARARVLLEAEEIALRYAGAAVLRLAGLYSGQRRIYSAGKAEYSDDKIVHFIHVHDAARAVAHVLDKRLAGVFNVHDGNPQRRSAILAKIGIDIPGNPDPVQRIISGRKFFSTGFRPAFGDYWAGTLEP